ncbi:MAG: DNA polymerase III subunit gamma/tau [Bacteroidales bacterium]|nr:DNA polymerase III subunit gamma/tau [Bacteroidales bacterium]
MENFIVSARKYRPQNFDAVIGQTSITNTLRNAIRKKQIAHAYLFCGPRGIGKTTCARIFAKTINCENPGNNIEACNECESCKSFNESRSYNIHELDAASNNSVDDIRNLIDQVRVPPQIGKYSTYIIDEVHMLSASAFNAFLKTLEEPPAHAIFILATTEKHKILPTILSRCQIFDFNRIKSEDIVAHLAYVAKLENVNIEPESLNIIAQKADGAMRDALSIFDQMVSFSGKDILHKTVLENLNVLDYDYYFRLTQNFIQHDISSSLMIFNEILSKGFDGHNFINGLSNHFRDLLVCKDEVTLPLLEIGASVRDQYLKQTVNCSIDFLYKALDICSFADINFKSSKNQRLHVELTLVKLCMLTMPANETEEKKKINKKEEKPSSNSPELVRNGKTKYEPSTPSIGRIINGKVTSAIEPQDADQGQSLAEKTRKEKQIENFSKEELMEKWLRFAEMMHKEKPRMATTLKASNPVIKDDFSIEIEMSNKVQEDDFNHMIKTDLANFLRHELKNDNLKIVTFVPETNKEKSLYTDEDKYKYLSEKNPNINKLKQRLNLDFE